MGVSPAPPAPRAQQSPSEASISPGAALGSPPLLSLKTDYSPGTPAQGIAKPTCQHCSSYTPGKGGGGARAQDTGSRPGFPAQTNHLPPCVASRNYSTSLCLFPALGSGDTEQPVSRGDLRTTETALPAGSHSPPSLLLLTPQSWGSSPQCPACLGPSLSPSEGLPGPLPPSQPQPLRLRLPPHGHQRARSERDGLAPEPPGHQDECKLLARHGAPPSHAMSTHTLTSLVHATGTHMHATHTHQHWICLFPGGSLGWG